MIRYFRRFKHLIRCFIILISVGFYKQNVSGQSLDYKINLELIHKKKVRQFIVDHKYNNLESYSQIHVSWPGTYNITDFHTHERDYTVKDSISKVWDCYLKANPVKAWDGRIIDFGLLISKNSNALLYESAGTFSTIDTGQVYFLNLKLLRGFYNIPVAFEIIEVDELNKTIVFSYIEDNVSKGKQVLQFVKLDDNTTEIIHSSYYLSDSKLRDGIYPYYHKKIINDFHRNMRRIIKNTES